MTEQIIKELRELQGLRNCIIRSVTVYSKRSLVKVGLVTDTVFASKDKTLAERIIGRYVPPYFTFEVDIIKLTPDCKMVEKKIDEIISVHSKSVYSTLNAGDITVEKTDGGFSYKIAVAPSLGAGDLCAAVNAELKKSFCGEFAGEVVRSELDLSDLEVEETPDEIEFETPVRTFPIRDFTHFEGDKIQKTAIYLADLNMVSGEDVVVCGTVEDIRERKYTSKRGTERSFFNFALNDGSATSYVTYFPRVKSEEKIREIKVGDSIVCTGANEEFNGSLRYTAKIIDYGKPPEGFVPAKRVSKPVPLNYHRVIPQPYVDMEQTDLFTGKTIPECLKGKTFVVFDLETTGLISSPHGGNMDKIIEIGAFKVIDGEIKESFTTFINPEQRLSDEIVNLTGITQDMVKDAPVYADVMPDFYKFCYGSILVGHNIAGFDYKFVEHYCAQCGYNLERKIIDTIPLAQELLFLSNYKLNTVADKFNITFNHHRAIDDALATAKIFIELIRMKKSLPKF